MGSSDDNSQNGISVAFYNGLDRAEKDLKQFLDGINDYIAESTAVAAIVTLC
jgi:hypothetical protein